jgi:hypothetical protein
MKLRRATAAVVTTATLALGMGALAVPAGAQTDTSGAPSAERVCEVVRTRWGRLVSVDARLREAYRRALAHQERLAANGREEAAARLGERLDRLQTRHANLVERARQLREKHETRCGALGDDLDTAALS